MKKTLRELLSVLDDYDTQADLDIVITGVTDDSRKVKPGNLFICRSGWRTSGYDYLEEVCQKGAAALLVDREISLPGKNIAFVTLSDTSAAMRKLVPAFFAYPAQKLKLVGITGTNGKTTTTYMLKSIFQAAGHKTGVIGTIDILIGDEKLPTSNTTPDVVELQNILFEMEQNAVEYVFMEVSSHALVLERVAGCEFDIAVLTNITQDHLDFHQTFASYVQAKGLLFADLEKNKLKQAQAVVNMDDNSTAEVLKLTKVPVLTYGFAKTNNIYPLQTEVRAQGMKITLQTPLGELSVSLGATGHFNIYNIMAAVGTAIVAGLDLTAIEKGLAGFKSVAGRFELVEAGQDFTVIVDYAHTPDGLENVLQSARAITQNRLIVVFGCGGDRDKTKRPLMGEIAVRLADAVYVTSDNPRTEVPEEIIADILTGIRAQAKVTKIVDRKRAITEALANARPGDVVVIAGKGHETYQVLGSKTIDFDDRLIAADFLKGKGNV